MKTRLLIFIYILFALSFTLYGEEIEKNVILSAMEFPSPVLNTGKFLNDPFFTINIEILKIDELETRKKIQIIESKGGYETNPERLYHMGNLYQDLKNPDKAINYYKQYLGSMGILNDNDIPDADSMQIKAEIHYILAEIDSRSKRVDNLEKSLFLYTKTLELKPETVSLWMNIGDCYLSMEKSTEALYCYNKYQQNSKNDFKIYSRIQSAEFHRDYLRLIERTTRNEIINQSITGGVDFTHLETAINNLPGEYKDQLKLQQYIYLLRLLLLKKEYYLTDHGNINDDINKLFTDDEISILNDAEKLIQKIDTKNIDIVKLKYLSGIINYLKANYKNALLELNQIPKKYMEAKLIIDDILFIDFYMLKNYSKVSNKIEDIIRTNPNPVYYLILAEIEYKNNNLNKAIMHCIQSLKIDENFMEAYSGLAVLYASSGNYIAADEMAKKGNSYIFKDNRKKSLLYNQMRVNEAAIALLKNEKERAYILLRSVISVDNNRKALQLYNRYFIKE